jgi:hypothetical protein
MSGFVLNNVRRFQKSSVVSFQTSVLFKDDILLGYGACSLV